MARHSEDHQYKTTSGCKESDNREISEEEYIGEHILLLQIIFCGLYEI